MEVSEVNDLKCIFENLKFDGVEYPKLNMLIDYEQPTKYRVESTNYSDEYKIPVLTAGQTFILGYTNEKEGIYEASKDNPVIIFDDFTTSFQWVDFRFKVKSSAMKILTVKNGNCLDLRYLYHCMKNINYIPVDHTRQWIEKYSNFRVPYPSDPNIRHKIVRILDSFTRLTTELTTELTAELTARNKQYEYYRDSLFSFEREVTWKPLLSFIRSLRTGLNPRQFFSLNTNNATNYYVTIREIQNNKIVFTNKTDKIDDLALNLCNNRSNLEIEDVLFSGTGTIGATALIEEEPNNWNIKEGIYSIKTDKKKLLPKFLMYLLQSTEIKKSYLSVASGGTVKSVSMEKMKNIKIPVIPIVEQERIIGIIEKFENFCNDISQALPAEIEARQKQYEYYRSALLSFKKKEVDRDE